MSVGVVVGSGFFFNSLQLPDENFVKQHLGVVAGATLFLTVILVFLRSKPLFQDISAGAVLAIATSLSLVLEARLDANSALPGIVLGLGFGLIFFFMWFTYIASFDE